jgi:HD-GYP domain-containing protein (c-di-GMP phosphodiesterase class II)
MTTDRPYRPALTQAVAVEELTKNSGTQFDPGVVDALVATISRREAGEPLAAATA